MVDIPGIGYAKVPLAEKGKWAQFFEVRRAIALPTHTRMGHAYRGRGKRGTAMALATQHRTTHI